MKLGKVILVIGFVFAVVASSAVIWPSPVFICLLYPVAIIGAAAKSDG